MEQVDNLVELPQAAEALGISQQALRKRIRKGIVPAVKVDGRWLLTADVVAHVKAADTQDRSSERSQDRGERNEERSQPQSQEQSGNATENVPGNEPYLALIAELRSQNQFLQQELEVRTEELRRKDIIIASFAQRLPELPPAKVDQPSWWKRLLGRAS